VRVAAVHGKQRTLAHGATPSHVPLAENAALEITAVRAVETAPAPQDIWSDADRAWASRAAAEVVGEGGSAETYLTTRARLALERIGERHAPFPRMVRALHWRSWVGTALVAAAFLAGLALDQVGGSQRVNLLAPPLFLVLAWNVAVYTLLAAGFILRYGDPGTPGLARHLLTRLSCVRPATRRGEWAATVAAFVERWSRESARLYGVRAARLLHTAAIAFSMGLLCGLYARGIALEYRATWESTFLGADNVHALLAIVLAPGAAISGIPVPGLAEVEAIRAPGSENAGRWLHLIAATVVLVVILPRLALALWAGMLERYRARHMPISLEEPYYARLLRGFRGGPVAVRVVPYSYALPPTESAGLERIVRRVFGANASLTIQSAIAYGGEDGLAGGLEPSSSSHVIALFNATATPEREAHGAFLEALGRQTRPGGVLVTLVDESAFRERGGGDPARLRERRASWSALCAERRLPCVFAALRASDLRDAEAELERAVEEAGR
jgi:hypothetical protein